MDSQGIPVRRTSYRSAKRYLPLCDRSHSLRSTESLFPGIARTRRVRDSAPNLRDLHPPDVAGRTTKDEQFAADLAQVIREVAPDEYRISRDDRGAGFAFGLERLAEVCVARLVPSSVERLVGRAGRRHRDVQDRHPPRRPVLHPGGIGTATLAATAIRGPGK